VPLLQVPLRQTRILQALIRRCAAMSPGQVTAIFTATAVVMAVPIGLGVWEILLRIGIPVLALMIAITAVIVAVPLANFLALTLDWGRAQQQSLRYKEALLLSAQRMAKLGHWRWTLGSGYYQLSEDICPLYGLTPDNPYLNLDRLFEIVHPDDHAAIREALHGLLEEHRPQEVEYRLRAPDGGYRTIWLDGRCEYDPDGRMISIFGVIQDITERKRIEVDLRAALERAEVASRAKSHFLASMSHELRTPLNAVLGFSEVMRDERLGTMANPRYREYAADIHDSGTHLLSLIDGLLDVAKIEAGRYELHETRLDLRSVIERAVRTVQPVAARKAQTIAMEVPEPAPVVLADERALHQILLNLLSNAIKFSYSGGVIELRVTLPAEGITITVEDHGIGIPPDQIADVGKPFFQAHAQTARIAGGTGIGLTVTRSLVDLHGGTLAVTSEYGHGTCVTIGLPAARLVSRAKPSAA
jgi:two-component system cell cycle sensor histidine kinase PleC